MTIHINNKTIEDVYCGKNVIQEIYYGSNLVYCRNIVLSIKAQPANALIEWTVDGKKLNVNSIIVRKGQTVSYKVSADGYWWEAETFVATKSKTFSINLRRSDFPREWGRYIKGAATCTYNDKKSDWEYAWALHFENGTLPVEVWRDLTGFNKSNLHYDWFSSDVSSELNSAVIRYADNRWYPAIAKDEADYMSWRRANGEVIGALVYMTAALWGWNNGQTTVVTNRFSFAVKGNNLNITKDGANFANFIVVV